MFPTMTPILALVAAVAIHVRADPNPTNPAPGDVFVEGKSCAIGWNADSTGLWKDMKIELMTGNNIDMVSLIAIATVDGTDPHNNTFSYPCPKVSPHSPIYFYQFSSPSSANNSWTGRFTITDSAADVVSPSQSTQPDGEPVPWGTGSLVGKSSSTTLSAPLATAAAAPTLSAATPAAPGSSVASNAYDSSVDNLNAHPSATPITDSTTTKANDAVTILSVPSIVVEAALALGLAAFGITVIF